MFARLKALSYQFANPIQDKINDFLANGVVPACIVISCIFFASDQLLGVKELAVSTSPHLICNRQTEKWMAGWSIAANNNLIIVTSNCVNIKNNYYGREMARYVCYNEKNV